MIVSSMLPVGLVVLIGVSCLLTAGYFGLSLRSRLVAGRGVVAWCEPKGWATLALPVLVAFAGGVALALSPLDAAQLHGLAALLGLAVAFLAFGLVLAHTVVIRADGVAFGLARGVPFLPWRHVEDYFESRGEAPRLTLFHRTATGDRARVDLHVPRRLRHRLSHVLSACIDARFEYAARVRYAGKALEG